VEGSVLGGLQPGLRDGQVVLSLRLLTSRLIVRGLQLCALRLNATIVQRVEARPRGFDECLGAGDLRLCGGELGWRATSTQLIELTLRRVDGGVASRHCSIRGALGDTARRA